MVRFLLRGNGRMKLRMIDESRLRVLRILSDVERKVATSIKPIQRDLFYSILKILSSIVAVGYLSKGFGISVPIIFFSIPA